MANTNTRVIFRRDPDGGAVQESHMDVVHEPFSVPSNLPSGSLVLRNRVLSLDPYMRGRMNTRDKGYIMPPFEIGSVITTAGICEVIGGSRQGIKVGDLVSAFPTGVETYTILPPEGSVMKLPLDCQVPPSYFLGVLGTTGATACRGIALAEVQEGETIFVSAAAGAVGQLVGQMAKMRSLRVIGSAGTDDKVKLLKSKFGFDEAFNYKKTVSIQDTLKQLVPNGIDIYFDNVGGEHLDAALACMNQKGRIIACGMISEYNGQRYAFANMKSLVFKHLKLTGFTVSEQLGDKNWMDQFIKDMMESLVTGKVRVQEHMVKGVENAPGAFVGLFNGVNVGKLLIEP